MCQKIIEKERPDALLPTLGGQTGLNCAIAVAETGILEKYGVEMIGANPEVIKKAEDRELFRDAMANINLRVPNSVIVRTLDEAVAAAPVIGYPVIRPSYTLGGTGGGIAYNRDEFESKVRRGIALSPVGEVLLEESVIGWKEYEMEVMRDVADNVVIVCSIENLDPMGVHTGDSITVAPAQTLTDKEYQRMRDATIAIMREIGVETGGSNVQFAINPEDGADGDHRNEPPGQPLDGPGLQGHRLSHRQDCRQAGGGLPAGRDPQRHHARDAGLFRADDRLRRHQDSALDVREIPGSRSDLTVQMKSVGETMAIGRTFKESLQKAIRGLEIGHFGLGGGKKDLWGTERQPSLNEIENKLATPNAERIFFLRYAFKAGMSVAHVHELTNIDPWFLQHIEELVQFEDEIRGFDRLAAVSDDLVRRAKRCGYSDRQLGGWWDATEMEVRRHRKARGIEATFKQVDTCAAEFEAYTPYYYSTYESEDETPPRQTGQEADHDSGRRAQPHRPGNRIRLLLLPGLVRPEGAGDREHHGQLESRDGLDRLRHVGPAVLRAADDRRRAQHLRPHAARRRDRAVRRADAAQPGPRAGSRRRQDHRHQSRHDRRRRRPRRGFRKFSKGSGCGSLPTASPRRPKGRGSSPTASATRFSCGPATCWGGGRWRSVTTKRRWSNT